MSDEKRDVSQSPVLLESNKALPEDKAPAKPASASKVPPGFESTTPEREVAKDSSTGSRGNGSDLQPHEELYHWKKPIKSAGVLGAGIGIYYFLVVQGYTVVSMIGLTLLFNLMFNGCVKLLFKPLVYLGVLDEKEKPNKYFIYLNEIVKGVLTSPAFTKLYESIKASVGIYDRH